MACRRSGVQFSLAPQRVHCAPVVIPPGRSSMSSVQPDVVHLDVFHIRFLAGGRLSDLPTSNCPSSSGHDRRLPPNCGPFAHDVVAVTAVVVAVSPCRRVAVSPCRRVAVSPCRRCRGRAPWYACEHRQNRNPGHHQGLAQQFLVGPPVRPDCCRVRTGTQASLTQLVRPWQNQTAGRGRGPTGGSSDACEHPGGGRPPPRRGVDTGHGHPARLPFPRLWARGPSPGRHFRNLLRVHGLRPQLELIDGCTSAKVRLVRERHADRP
jgi:hypothetical protein